MNYTIFNRCKQSMLYVQGTRYLEGLDPAPLLIKTREIGTLQRMVKQIKFVK